MGDNVPVLLMLKNKTGSVKTVSVRRLRLPHVSVGVVECAVSRELSDFILEPVDNPPLACSQRVPSINLGNRVNSV